MTTKCVGVEKNNPIVYKQNGQYKYDTIGGWIDRLMTENASNVTVDDAVETLELNDPTLQIWTVDQVGLSQEKRITLVQRTDLTKLSPSVKQLLFIATNNGTNVILGADTPLMTRVNNEVGRMPANEFVLDDPYGCMMGCNTWSYIIADNGPRLVQYPMMDYMQVPHVITQTWGELLLSRQNCADLVDVCDRYPDQVEPGDRNVFDSALTEQIQYDPLNRIDPSATTYFTQKYLYFIDTEWGNFQSYMNSFLMGTPHISPLFKPTMSKEKLGEAKKKSGTVEDATKLIEEMKNEKVKEIEKKQ